MNQRMDTKEVLTLQETPNGYDLYINTDKQELLIHEGKIVNDLTKKQRKFVNDNVDFRRTNTNNKKLKQGYYEML